MTFNEGMQIDTSTTSSSGGGRGPGRGIAIGGGIGGLLIVVLAMFLGVDPGTVMPQQQPMDTSSAGGEGFDLSQCKTGADANSKVECRVVATGNSVDGVWQQLLKGYTRPHVRLFKGQVQTGCGPATSDVGPFYCPSTGRRTSTPTSSRCSSTSSVPAEAHSPRSTSSPTNSATTYRT